MNKIKQYKNTLLYTIDMSEYTKYLLIKLNNIIIEKYFGKNIVKNAYVVIREYKIVKEKFFLYEFLNGKNTFNNFDEIVNNLIEAGIDNNILLNSEKIFIEFINNTVIFSIDSYKVYIDKLKEKTLF